MSSDSHTHAPVTRFDVWGCRGSRTVMSDSTIGNLTSCYSLVRGDTLIAIDGGRGLAQLAAACEYEPHLQGVRRVHILLTHAHMDHWEGLKDAEWFWRPKNGLQVSIHASGETHETVDRGFSPPAFVPLEVLALTTVDSLSKSTMSANCTYQLDGFQVETFPLNHYSGAGDEKRYLDTLGFRISIEGATFAYLSDHEPAADTTALEAAMLDGAHLAVCDAHFADTAQQAFGHGSVESIAGLARLHSHALILAAHHNPNSSDGEIEAAFARHGAGVENFALAREGHGYCWNPTSKAFERP